MLSPRRDIAAVEVDSSSFQKLRDEYQFSSVLKNRFGHLAVAMPAVELTLTDAADQPVLRRVLLEAHWNAPRSWRPRANGVFAHPGARAPGGLHHGLPGAGFIPEFLIAAGAAKQRKRLWLF